MGLVGSGMVKYGVAIGADTSQGAPGDPLEYSASAGGASFLVGAKDMIAVINHTSSFTTDTPDFWRREGQDYPSHGGRFTGEPAYFKHVTSAAKLVLKKMNSQPADYQYAVFHQPNGKFPQRVAKMLGFSDKQVEVGLLTPKIGNTYSGAVPLGLSAVLDVAQPGERIFVVAYGSGAGADGFDITVTDGIARMDRSAAPLVSHYIEDKRIIDYATYAKFRGKIRVKEEVA
jgi:hydroxymethylglutaryl-CoA synthase